jgi:hypothetical protein
MITGLLSFLNEPHGWAAGFVSLEDIVGWIAAKTRKKNQN